MEAKKHGIKSLMRVGSTNNEIMHPLDISKVAAEPESRKNFAKQISDLLEKYNFDGVYIYWRYPGCPVVRTAIYLNIIYYFMYAT